MKRGKGREGKGKGNEDVAKENKMMWKSSIVETEVQRKRQGWRR